MTIIQDDQWYYDKTKSYECNMQSWMDAVYWERKKYDERQLTTEEARMKFQEMYPRRDYGET
tara:strand:+ start:1643 stop:1828 length:186 start_codon:yes stop_codon:yes gene_type:complete